VLVTNSHGLHARPCVAIVNLARQYQAAITLRKNGQSAGADHILDLMSLGAAQGTELVLSAEGPDAEQAVEALARLFAHEFEIVYKD
jgi:phosphotransferase system HPr (HPr) family protein